MDLSASEAGEDGCTRSTVDCGISGCVCVVVDVFERGGSGGGTGRGSSCGLLSGFNDNGTTSLFCPGKSLTWTCDSDCISEVC